MFQITCVASVGGLMWGRPANLAMAPHHCDLQVTFLQIQFGKTPTWNILTGMKTEIAELPSGSTGPFWI